MLHLAVICLLVALGAGVLGFGALASTAAGAARALFALSLLLVAAGMLIAALRDRRARNGGVAHPSGGVPPPSVSRVPGPRRTR